MLLAQIKARDNSCKLKDKTTQILYLYQLQFNEVIITIGVHINDKNLLIITEPKTISFDLPQDVVNNLKQEADYITNKNEFLAQYTIKNEISWSLSIQKHGNNIHEH